MNILEKILETKQREVAEAKASVPYEDILKQARAVERPISSFSGALRNSGSSIIAEFKRRSPSKGFIHAGADVRRIVGGYAEHGAAAISVLTDSDYFGGSLDDLRQARTVTGKPLLRKDFIIDPYQICQARIAGADVVLLIAAALSPGQCAELSAFAASLGLEVLLELHGEEELGHINAHVSVIGVNNRNLGTFVTDTAVSKRMAPLLPRGTVRISESGISSVPVIEELRRYGYRGFLMGENFMKRHDPATALASCVKELEK